MPMSSRDWWDRYEQHLARGGAPFGGEFNACIADAVEAYAAVIRRYRADLGGWDPAPESAQDETGFSDGRL